MFKSFVRASASRAHNASERSYELEPLAVAHGVFHPKLTVLAAMDECHLLVGSGNLTFGGWGGNCENLEHLHPSFAASAIADAAYSFISSQAQLSSRIPFSSFGSVVVRRDEAEGLGIQLGARRR
jgi:hypothetical protein